LLIKGLLCINPEKIEVTETGLEIETIDNVIKALNQSSQEVYLSLFD